MSHFKSEFQAQKLYFLNKAAALPPFRRQIKSMIILLLSVILIAAIIVIVYFVVKERRENFCSPGATELANPLYVISRVHNGEHHHSHNEDHDVTAEDDHCDVCEPVVM